MAEETSRAGSGRAASEPEFQFSLPHLLPILATFVLLRLLLLRNFPFFNDEALNTQWSQLMLQDWDRNKWLPVDNAFHNWRPPLTFWLAKLALGAVGDPMLAARLTSACASVAGVVSTYAFAGYWFRSRRTAFWAGVFWTLNPMTLFYDREFVTETFVYSFAAAAYLFTFLAISRHKAWSLPAAAFAAMAILSKQSGLLYAYGLIFMVALQVRRRPDGMAGPRFRVDWRSVWVVPAIILASLGIYRLVIPARYFGDYDSFNHVFMFTIPEMLKFPLAEWGGNATRIFDLFRSYYSLLALALVGLYAWRCAVRRDVRDLMVLGWLALNGVLLVVYFKFFNEYMFHTSNALFLTLVSAVGAGDAGEIVGTLGLAAGSRRLARASVALLLASLWAWQDAWHYASPQRYIEKFGTEWMKTNYLAGWPSGFGTERAMDLLAEETPKAVLLDPQWGNPRAAIEVYARTRYPRHQLLPLSYQTIRILDRVDPGAVIAIFRLYPGETRWRPPGLRPMDQLMMALPICRRPLVLSPPSDTPLVYCKY